MKEDILALVEELDEDGSGELDFDEFVELQKRLKSKAAEREESAAPYFNQKQLEGFRETFNTFGGADDGAIDADELALIYASMGVHMTRKDVQRVVEEVSKA